MTKTTMTTTAASSPRKHSLRGRQVGRQKRVEKSRKRPKGRRRQWRRARRGKREKSQLCSEKKASSANNGLAIEMAVNKGQDAEKKKKADAGAVNFAAAMKASGWSDPTKG